MDTSNSKIVGIIPARYGSTRFPGKMLADLKGQPLIQRTYCNALKCSILDKLYVATDDKRIYDHVQSFGGSAIMTSSECPSGSDRILEALQSTAELSDADIVLNIQGDEPCVAPEVITSIAELLISDSQAMMTTPVTPILSDEEFYNPSVVKCVMDNDYNALLFSRAPIPYLRDPNTALPTAYRHLGLYAFRHKFLVKYSKLSHTPLQVAENLEQLKVLEHGYRIKVAIVNDRGIGVDVPEDIKKVEKLL
ncbi:MAG: 3-deoxy-manno-octulosonate cytidylyltransferase [Chlamydiota bacterium]